ncbi:MAG: aldo/keto reductase, partial [Rhizobacter sp.]|nr:aldo/keto reductase [Rhizobacter sp.]
AERNGKTVGQMAIAWTLRHPAVTAAIVGARRPEQVEDNVGAMGWRLRRRCHRTRRAWPRQRTRCAWPRVKPCGWGVRARCSWEERGCC